MRKLIAGAILMFLGVSVVAADEFFGAITKVDGNKITVSKRKKGEKTREEVSLTVADNVKVVKGKLNKEDRKIEPGEALEGGLKNARFSQKRSFALIVTNTDNAVTEIRVTDERFGKKKKKADSN